MKRILSFLSVLFCSLAIMAQHVPQAYTYNVSNLSKKDFKKCMKAAKKGDADQQFVLATCYKDGKWVDRDNMMAIDWYTKSSEQGNDDAASVLAYVYENGVMTEKNMTKAVTYYTRLGEHGYQRAQEFLGNWYYSRQDYASAVPWLTKTASQGNKDDQYKLGCLYFEGKGVSQNYTEAVSWFGKAAGQGDLRSQEFLGNWYYSQQDYASAVPWLTKTASRGNKDDQYKLGCLYFEGKGVSQDYKEAVKWFGKAAGQGDAGAQYYLGWCHENGKGVPQSYSEALSLYRKAADKGHTLALYNLGLCYMKGRGVSRNYDEAKKWLLKAADKGNDKAKSALAEIERVSDRTFTVNGVSFKMIYVQGGTFTMGATSEQGSDANFDEEPAHRVTLSNYYIGQTEVTQELWQAVMGSNPSKFKGNKRPVEWVSWDDCQTFITKLNNLTGQRFRLPTEAEWEYAARGGNKSRGYKYSGSNNLPDVAWYDDSISNDDAAAVDAAAVAAAAVEAGLEEISVTVESEETYYVATKSPNELGIYDMSGNVWEWCQDWYDNEYYSHSPQMNPQGSSLGSTRVCRGGSWYSGAGYCRVAYRYYYFPDYRSSYLGFRLAL